MSYGMTVGMLADVLPLEDEFNTTTVRRQVHGVAERLESELGEERHAYIDGCPMEWEKLPRPDPGLTVGIDGGYVHSRHAPSRREGWFEVIAGKSMADGTDSKCFAFVNRYDTKPKRRLFELLKSQGMQMNQHITFVSDGGDTVRNLQLYLSPQAEHLLDWFHVTMRLTVLGQMAKGLRSEDCDDIAGDTAGKLDRLKWYLWHGNVFRALQTIDNLDDLAALAKETEKRAKFEKTLEEFGGYIAVNKSFIPNYGDRYRNGETISSAPAESTINQVVSKRFVKKQQMRWTERGAHLLLQVRTKTLNEDLRSTFSRWYPEMSQAA